MKVATISSDSIVMNNNKNNNQCQEEDENQSLLELDSFLESYGQNQQGNNDEDEDDDDDDDESSSVNDDNDSDSDSDDKYNSDDDLGDHDDFVGCQNEKDHHHIHHHHHHSSKLQPILDSDIVQGHHMIDVIDPDAVDFAPFLTNPSGTAINYHDESHMLTEHHEKLHRKKKNTNQRQDNSSSPSPSPSPTNHDMISCYSFFTSYCYYPYISRHPLPYQEANFNTEDDWQQQQYNPEAEKTPLRPRRTKSPITICRRYFCSLLDGDDESGRTKYIILAMFVFILYSTTRRTVKGYFDNSSSSMSTIIQKVPHDESYQHTSTKKNNSPWIPPDIQAAYRDVDDLPIAMMDTPIYWHIPRSGGTTMKLIFSMCMGRVVACEQGAGHQLDEQLELLNKPFGNFANVDTSTPLGLHRAAELGLIPSRQVDVILTPHVREATKLFDDHHQGRLFTMFRHPVERVVSLYYFLRMPDQETILGWNVQDMTLEQFATDISENWMVRSLTKTMRGPLTADHLQVAKEIIRTKFLIGLMEQKTESLRRIQSYFDWKLPSRISQTCKNNMFYFEPQSKNVHDFLDPNSKDYEIVAKRNQFDMDLYDYAVYLFEEQSTLIPMK